MKNLVIADIDGCCIDNTERLAHYNEKAMDTYESLHHLDTPIQQGVEVYKAFLDNPAFRVAFITGRQERQRVVTYLQLSSLFGSHLLTGVPLIMRPNHIFSKDVPCSVLKPQLLLDHGYTFEEVFLAFDDHTDIVNAWRERGIVAYQTAPRHK